VLSADVANKHGFNTHGVILSLLTSIAGIPEVEEDDEQ
jgi:hypothetical protein